ncbi:2-iminoacetate synthase ThiH [Marinomonas mediterranea]|uniref:Thiazole biosynthesis protein ThiH n=1 Tax=Marinomonas mediterranea (strain ATCC 700492 / JCM 21426 / NBRC 103028 / MMB-1) TaxID=717774 RepID=F2K279_MARM1|nr:2-iminoacetate synthase ThiH [Marinomonas mediterranea]ADZ91157.1 thiazole biosynthesis protein ThiH [Marinomonas mediterranea MMB-1]WCN17287.1 2-iminoacetate synthase ThiH [Marinomonas mediterranea MMB-1]
MNTPQSTDHSSPKKVTKQRIRLLEQSAAVSGQFSDVLENHLNWEEFGSWCKNATTRDVEQALASRKKTLFDFAALISEAAKPYLMEMITQSERLTMQRFGNTVSLFAPLYLSNTCANECTYCGFSMSNAIKRLTLSAEQIDCEIAAIKSKGFDSILLVTGETNKVSMPYFEKVLPQFKPAFSQLSMEVQPLESSDYKRLQSLGLDAVLVYQETYRRQTYLEHHLRGNKSNFNYRLDAPDRIGQAGIHKIGLGVLLGLDDWRIDSVMMAAHLRHLQKRYWRSRFSVAFPRIRPCEGGIQPKSVISDKELIQLMTAWRLFDADVEMSLSTRESAEFRKHAIRFGVTTMSAESKTQPGGYAEDAKEALEQFEISDDRSVYDVSNMIRQQGREVVWKDWDPALR